MPRGGGHHIQKGEVVVGFGNFMRRYLTSHNTGEDRRHKVMIDYEYKCMNIE